jgi:hypothetical protein
MEHIMSTYEDLEFMDFDHVFTITEDGTIEDADEYAPSVEHDDKYDVLIDGTPHLESETWEAFSTGYTGQHGYNGPVMHVSEYLSGGLADDMLSTPGIFVIEVVDAPCDYDDPDTLCDIETGCGCDPAGWIVLRKRD